MYVIDVHSAEFVQHNNEYTHMKMNNGTIIGVYSDMRYTDININM